MPDGRSEGMTARAMKGYNSPPGLTVTGLWPLNYFIQSLTVLTVFQWRRFR